METKNLPPLTKPSRVPWNKGLRGKQVAWNKGKKLDREEYPTMGHFKKHSKDTKERIKSSLKVAIDYMGRDKWAENSRLGQSRSILVGKKNGSFHGTLGRKGELSYVWLGDKATYNSKHRWIHKNWIKTGVCHRCGIQARPYGKCLSGTHWHNIKKDYNRDDTSGWVELCPKCHNLTHKEICN